MRQLISIYPFDSKLRLLGRDPRDHGHYELHVSTENDDDLQAHESSLDDDSEPFLVQQGSSRDQAVPKVIGNPAIVIPLLYVSASFPDFTCACAVSKSPWKRHIVVQTGERVVSD
jgi:hypothetical protein